MINGEGEMKYDKVSKYQGSWVNGMVRYAVLCRGRITCVLL